MTDIVELMEEAADEIERLRAVLWRIRGIAQMRGEAVPAAIEKIIREALK
jgi:hypothetical protein